MLENAEEKRNKNGKYGDKNFLVAAGREAEKLLDLSEKRNGGDVLRSISRLHKKREVHILALSVYHNVIITGSYDRRVIFYNYEFCRLIGKVEFDSGVFPTAVEFINGFGLVLIATSDQKLYLVDYQTSSEMSNIRLRLLGFCNPNHHIPMRTKNSQEYHASCLEAQIKRKNQSKQHG